MTVSYLSENSFSTFRLLALGGPCQCLNDDRLERLFFAIISTRKTRKVSFGIVRDTLDKLGTYGPDVIVAAVDAYLEKQEGQGGYSEKYLIGIARGEAKRKDRVPSRAPSREEPKPDPRPSAGEGHLRMVVTRLRALYAKYEPDQEEAHAIVEAGKGINVLADEVAEGQGSAADVDRQATDIEFKFRQAVPGVKLPPFTPYGF